MGMKYIRDILMTILICASVVGVVHEVVNMPTSNVSLKEAIALKREVAATQDELNQSELSLKRMTRNYYEKVDEVQSYRIAEKMQEAYNQQHKGESTK